MYTACVVPSLPCLFGEASQTIYTLLLMTSSPAALDSPYFILRTSIAETVLDISIETLGW
jgi:hypothetical protein